MIPVTALDVAAAAGVLLATVGVGTVAHELCHAAVLRAFGVPYDVAWGVRGDGAGRFGGGLAGTWATVTPRDLPRGLSPWVLRLAALAPFALAAPAVLVPLGVLPDPLAAADPALAAATVAWLGCALPSPRDFSLFWHAADAIADRTA